MSTQLRPNKRQKRTAYTHEQKKWLWNLYKQRFKAETKLSSFLLRYQKCLYLEFFLF